MSTIQCRICGKETNMTGTRMCDQCWELDKRIRERPDLASKILHEAGYMYEAAIVPKDAPPQKMDILKGPMPKLHAPSRYPLHECLRELCFGRPAAHQKFLTKLADWLDENGLGNDDLYGDFLDDPADWWKR